MEVLSFHSQHSLICIQNNLIFIKGDYIHYSCYISASSVIENHLMRL